MTAMSVNQQNVQALISAFLPMRRQQLGAVLAGLSEEQAEHDLPLAVSAASSTLMFHLFIDTEEPLDRSQFRREVARSLRVEKASLWKVEAVLAGLEGVTAAFEGVTEDEKLEISLAVLETASKAVPASELEQLTGRAAARAAAMGHVLQLHRPS
ncbi:hypothetical protein [Kineosporia babensis]|uniref:Uncharacterized protein n=1 Tax=Kineosporia babensis TaxID=499548 RepID=A0A9X1NEP0_9ACTN|nr:hypothetical protein [Kineosporia babensis]MCD5312743.1 hypothetical protein [Kineosporia babensis]